MTYQEKYAPFFERLSQYSNLSLLQQVFYEEDITSEIKKLFLEEKYVPTREDIKFVKNEYIEEKDGDTGKDSILSHLSFIVFYIKVLDSGLDLSLVSKKRKFLLAILSLKEKRVTAVIVRNATVVVVGASLIKAFNYLEVAECSAKSIVQGIRMGKMVAINDAQVAELREYFKAVMRIY